jgi:hypothetical protein
VHQKKKLNYEGSDIKLDSRLKKLPLFPILIIQPLRATTGPSEENFEFSLSGFDITRLERNMERGTYVPIRKEKEVKNSERRENSNASSSEDDQDPYQGSFAKGNRGARNIPSFFPESLPVVSGDMMKSAGERARRKRERMEKKQQQGFFRRSESSIFEATYSFDIRRTNFKIFELLRSLSMMVDDKDNPASNLFWTTEVSLSAFFWWNWVSYFRFRNIH